MPILPETAIYGIFRLTFASFYDRIVALFNIIEIVSIHCYTDFNAMNENQRLEYYDVLTELNPPHQEHSLRGNLHHYQIYDLNSDFDHPIGCADPQPDVEDEY